MIIRLIGGPLSGTIHEVAGGFPKPDEMRLPDESGHMMHVYEVAKDGDTARFRYSFPKSERERHEFQN